MSMTRPFVPAAVSICFAASADLTVEILIYATSFERRRKALPGMSWGGDAFARHGAAGTGGCQIDRLSAAADAELDIGAGAYGQGAGHVAEHGGFVGVRVVGPPFPDEIGDG